MSTIQDTCVSSCFEDGSSEMAATREFQSLQKQLDLIMAFTVGIILFLISVRLFMLSFGTTKEKEEEKHSKNIKNKQPNRSSKKHPASMIPSCSYPGGNGVQQQAPSPSPAKSETGSIESYLPRKSSYYSMPFFADTVATKQEFIESLFDLGNEEVDGWLLIKNGIQRKKKWKKRYVVLDANARIRYYANAEAARKKVNIKGSLTVHLVKPADPSGSGPNTLEVRGTLGGIYFFRAEDEMSARKWLCVLTKRAIQGCIPGRIDADPNSAALAASAAVDNVIAPAYSPSSTSSCIGGDASETHELSSVARGALQTYIEENSNVLKTHTLEVIVEEMTYTKEACMRQFYAVVKFKSELHNHLIVPVGQTAPKSCESSKIHQGLYCISWQEKLSWHFQDHLCSECNECASCGAFSGSFCGLPDLMVLQIYENTLCVINRKVGQTSISLSELFGYRGMKQATLQCTWPMMSSTCTERKLGQLSLQLIYQVTNVNVNVNVNAKNPNTSVIKTPFLVSSQEERELLAHYEIHPSIKDTKMFFQLFYANGTETKWEPYFKARGDTEMQVGEWTPSIEHGGLVCIQSFRALTNASIGPASTMTTNTKHVSFTNVEKNLDPKRLEIQTKTKLHDIPYGDCFTVEQVLVIVPKEEENNHTSSSSHLIAKVYIAIPFSKGCMFKSKIISETKKSVANSMELLFKILNESIVPEEERITGSGRATSEASPDKSKLAYSASTSGSRIETSASREPRLNSSTLDGTVALEEVFENQRVSIFGKWGPNHLLPTDRARFTNRNGVVELSFEKTQLPPHWVWTSPWKIDHNYTECDEEGWSYATDFPRFKTHLERGKSNQKKLGASVRRRRWIRTMCYVPPENQA